MGEVETDALIGTCLAGTYRIVRRLGEGGMGVVYEADHERLPRRFAVKVLREDRLEASTIELFRWEAENACRLCHRHIVDVIDYNVNPDGMPYIVMELLTGQDLAARLKRSRRLSITEAQTILRQAASAITAAHEAGLVHSDLKPSNLFLCQRGATEDYLKVLDFGVARLAYGRAALAGRLVAGTPWYMAPEQLSSVTYVDPRTDVWALAVILFQMLSGRLPFEGSVPETLAKIVGEEPQPLQRFNQRLGPALDVVLGRALAKRPEQRFASVRDFVGEFMECIKRTAAKTDWGEELTPSREWVMDPPTRNDILSADTISNPALAARDEPEAPPANAPSRELRRAERAPGRLAVYSEGYFGSTVDLSATGALIQTHRRIAPGARCEFKFAVPGTFGLLQAEARVVRTQELRPGAGAHVGIELMADSVEAQEALKWYVEWLRAGRPCGWRIKREAGAVTAALFGTLSEYTDLEPVLAALTELPAHVTLNLRDLRRMNSVAVGSWIRFVIALAKRARVFLDECSVPFLETALLVPNVVFKTTIRSFYLPSHCPGCGEDEGHLVHTAADVTPAGELSPELEPRTRCFNCGEQVVFDDICPSLLAVIRDAQP